MLTKNNEIKLIDFGIARTFNENKDSDTEYYVSQGFSSPEQYGTGQSDERSDIYSLGALLYSLLIGGKPKIKDFKFESLKNYINISDELDNAIMLATEFRPENRPSSISEFMNLLNLPSKVYDIKTTDDIVEDTKYIRTSKNKPKNNIIVSAITILSLIFGGYIIKNLINTEVETSNTNTKDIVTKTENVRNIKDIKDPTNEEIIRAMDEVYAETNVDKSKVKYEYSPKDNYILEDFIKEDNYVFKSHNIDEKGNIVSTDPYNYLVNKQTFEVMMYFAGGQLAVIDTTIDEKYQKYYYKLNPNIKKAYESIFETVGINGITKYEYRPEEEDGSYSDLRGEYYLFEDYDYFVGNHGDSMIAVHKKTLEVYTYEYAAPDYEEKLIKYGKQPNYEDDENIESAVVDESVREDTKRNLKEEYIQKLESIQDEVSNISYDGNTIEMKYASSEVLKKWDDTLNEIYGVLKTQLSSSEMELLKAEQREWIKIRDARAEKEASEFEGGTMYGLVYTEELGRLTKERCYELVQVYMK